MKKPEQVSYLNRHGTRCGTDDANHFSLIDYVLLLEGAHHRRRGRVIRRTGEIIHDRLVVEQEVVRDEVHDLLERDRVAIARVEYACTQAHVRQ